MKNIWIIAGLIVLISFFIVKNNKIAPPTSDAVVVTPKVVTAKPTLVPVTEPSSSAKTGG
jgi:hypothetical protein